MLGTWHTVDAKPGHAVSVLVLYHSWPSRQSRSAAHYSKFSTLLILQMLSNHCSCISNSALYGGAIYVDESSEVQLLETYVAANRARSYGGGVYTESTSKVW